MFRCDALRFTRIKDFKCFFIQKYKAELMENICGHGIVLESSVRGISKATRANISVSGQKIFPDLPSFPDWNEYLEQINENTGLQQGSTPFQ